MPENNDVQIRSLLEGIRIWLRLENKESTPEKNDVQIGSLLEGIRFRLGLENKESPLDLRHDGPSTPPEMLVAAPDPVVLFAKALERFRSTMKTCLDELRTEIHEFKAAFHEACDEMIDRHFTLESTLQKTKDVTAVESSQKAEIKQTSPQPELGSPIPDTENGFPQPPVIDSGGFSYAQTDNRGQHILLSSIASGKSKSAINHDMHYSSVGLATGRKLSSSLSHANRVWKPGGTYCADDCVRRSMKLSSHGPGMSLHIENALNINGWGVEKDINEMLQSYTVYSNVSTGVLAQSKDLIKAFVSDDHTKICLEILDKGELPITGKEREWGVCVVSKYESRTQTSTVCDMGPRPCRECDFLVTNMEGRLEMLDVSVHAEGGTSITHYDEHDDMSLQTNKPLLPIATETNSVVALSKKLQRQEMSKGITKQEDGEGIFSVEVHVFKQYPVLSQIARFFAQLHASNGSFVDSDAVVKTLVHQFVDSSVLVNQMKMATAIFKFNSVSLLTESVALAATSLGTNTRTQQVANKNGHKGVISDFLQLQREYCTRFKLKSEERVACRRLYSEILFKILCITVETLKQLEEMNLESRLIEVAKLVSQLFTPNVRPQEEEIGVVIPMAEYDKEQRKISEEKAQSVQFTLLQHRQMKQKSYKTYMFKYKQPLDC